MEKIYILVPVHNRCKITKQFLQCLKTQTYSNYHLVLIDDGSTDGTEEMVVNEIPGATIIKGQGKWWWAGSLQQGYSWLQLMKADPDALVLIVNDDTEFQGDFLENACSFMKGRERVLLLAMCYSNISGELMDAGVHWDSKEWRFENAKCAEDINCLSTRGLFFRVRDFGDIGGFYPRILPHYLSDYEFTIRAAKKGYKLTVDSSVKLWTDEEPSGDSVFDYNNYLVFLKKYFSKRSHANPFYQSYFAVLAGPSFDRSIIQLYRIWKNTCLDLFYRPVEDGFVVRSILKPAVRLSRRTVKSILKTVGLRQ